MKPKRNKGRMLHIAQPHSIQPPYPARPRLLQS